MSAGFRLARSASGVPLDERQLVGEAEFDQGEPLAALVEDVAEQVAAAILA